MVKRGEWRRASTIDQPEEPPFSYCALEAIVDFSRVLRGTHGGSWVAQLEDWGQREFSIRVDHQGVLTLQQFWENALCQTQVIDMC